MYGMPRGILSFATRAAIDSLPTPQNLKLWGKRLNGNCSLCNCKGTLAHILNMCTVALQQGRLTYRHNSVLRYVVKEVKKSAEENGMQIDLFADLPGLRVNGGTVPSYIIPTTEKPDVVLCFPEASPVKVVLIELTVPFEPNIRKARERKEDRYAQLNRNIRSKKHESHLICFEVGSRGVITKENKQQIKSIFRHVGSRKCRDVMLMMSKVALIGSYVIYNARGEPQWTDIALLD